LSFQKEKSTAENYVLERGQKITGGWGGGENDAWGGAAEGGQKIGRLLGAKE